MNTHHSQELRSLSPSLWREYADHGGGPALRCIEVAVFPRLRLGISSRGRWVRLQENRGLELSEEESLTLLLPCLEEDREAFVQAMHASLNKLGLSTDWLDSLPLASTVSLALRSGSEHWVKLGLGWCAKDCDLRADCRSALQEAAASAPTQHLRHMAKRIGK